MRIAVTLATFALVGASTCLRAAVPPESSKSQAPQQQTQEAAKYAYENKLICTKRQTTGSLLSKKTCKTQAQIDQERKDAQTLLHNQRRTGAGAAGTAVISDF